MIDFLLQFFNSVVLFFTDISGYVQEFLDFLYAGLYDFFIEWFASFVIWSTISMIKFKIFMITVAWDVTQQILIQLDISSALASAWSQIDSRILNALTFFNIPEAINIILSARVTRYVLDFMGV